MLRHYKNVPTRIIIKQNIAYQDQSGGIFICLGGKSDDLDTDAFSSSYTPLMPVAASMGSFLSNLTVTLVIFCDT